MHGLGWRHSVTTGLLVALLLSGTAGAQENRQADPAAAPADNSNKVVVIPDALTLRSIFDEAVKLFADEKTSNEPGEKRKESRERADLIAQQQMAAAAERMIFLTWIQICVGIVGSLFLVGTLATSVQATRAAVKAANIAERHLIASERPWIRFEARPASDLTFHDFGGTMMAQILFQNVGSGTAQRVRFESGEVSFFTDDIAGEIDKWAAERLQAYDQTDWRGGTVFPNEIQSTDIGLRIDKKWLDHAVFDPETPSRKAVTAVFVISATYTSILGGPPFQTIIALCLMQNTPDQRMRSVFVDVDEKRPRVPADQMVFSTYPGTYKAA